MAKKGSSRRGVAGELSRFLDSQIKNINDTFQIMEAVAPRTLDKAGWTEVMKLGEQVSRQATVAGMLWCGEAPDAEALKENIISYFNVLQGFLLLCHGSTVGAGPTLHKFVHGSAKRVVDCSLLLFKKAVSLYESKSPERKVLIPPLTGAVWEACDALKKVPTTNCTAIGRAMTEVCVILKDIIRELKELPIGDSAVSMEEEASDGAIGTAVTSDKEELSSDNDFDDDFTPEEASVIRLIISVASDSLLVVKEVIRFVTGLLKNLDGKPGTDEDQVNALERLLSHCKEISDQVNELAASTSYPPQDIAEMKTSVEKLYGIVRGISTQIGSLTGSSESAFAALRGFDNSLGELKAELGADIADKIEKLSL